LEEVRFDRTARNGLKSTIKVFPGIPFLNTGKDCEKYLPMSTKTIASQKTEIEIMPPFIFGCGGKGSQRERVACSLNAIINKALQTDCTHIWLCNADTTYPEDSLETLIRLDVDVASGISPAHADWNNITVGHLLPKGGLKFYRREEIAGRIVGENEVVSTGNFCILAKRRAFLDYSRYHIPLRFQPRRKKGSPYASEIQFFLDAQRLGLSVRIHGGVECGHLPEFPLGFKGPEDAMHNKVKDQEWRLMK